jgi:uncharacterized protein YecT (DUF1311 family)
MLLNIFGSGRARRAFLPFGFLVAFAITLSCFVLPQVVAGQQPASPQAPAASTSQPDTAGQADSAQPTEMAPPAPANFKNLIPADQLAFLRDYDGKMPKEIRKDKRFKELEKLVTPPTQYFYHYDKGLSEARDEVFDNEPLPIHVRDGRYVMVSTAGGPDAHMQGRGFLWFDMETGIGLGGIYFHPTNGEPAPTLAIFSRQLTDTALSMGQLPGEFYDDFGAWARAAHVKVVSPRYFIPANGKKYVLVHDEDYCAHPDNAPPPAGCEQLNADAADADMNAAYFMQQTHNASDATAFMLGPDQMAWITVRDRTCVGPNGMACRIEVTRRRTAALIGRPVPPPRPMHQ